MSISSPFVHRPIATSLLMAGILLIGAVAYVFLPVAPLPQVDFPTIRVEANLPGASAETMATAVTTPLERALSTISGIETMTSESSLGSSRVVLQFDLAKNIDAAAQDIQAAINTASGTMPQGLPSPPAYEKVNPADFTLLSLAVTSDTLPLTELDRYADNFLAQQLSQLPGVGMIDFHGEQKPAVRVRIDPEAIARLGLTLEDVRGIIGLSTVNTPKGSLDGPARDLVLNTTDQMFDAAAYRALIVAYRHGAPIRIGDLGTVLDGAEDIRQAAWLQGVPTIIIDIHKQPGFNVIETIQRIKDRLPVLMQSLPPQVAVHVVGDRTQTIRSSVEHIQVALAISVGLVVLVIFAFLRNVWATVIPAIAIPLSFCATFAVMRVLGFSLDNLSLMALTVAVGFVVDDAIVVIENVVRHVERGEPPLQATLDGAHEVGFTIVSMTLSLIAVFIPILFMGGAVGRLFGEFAITISVAVVASGIVSLTVTPMLCARFVRSHAGTAPAGWISRACERGFNAMHRFYAWSLAVVLRHRRLTLVATLATLALAVWLYLVIPKGFFPPEDTGLISGSAEAEPDISFAAMSDRIQALARIAQDDPAVDNVYCWIGSNISQGRVMINLKPLSERTASAAAVVARLKPRLAKVEGAALYMQLRQDIQIGGRSSKTQYQYTLQDANSDELATWAHRLEDKFKTIPVIQDINSDIQAEAPKLTLRIDRDSAARLGVSIQAIDDTLYDAFGQRQVAAMFTQLNEFRVVLEVDPRVQGDTEILKRLFVRSSLGGQLIPLDMVTTHELTVTPLTINHQSGFPSITLSFNLAPGHALSEAIDAVRAAEREIGKPDAVIATFQGTAQAFLTSLKTQPYLIAAAILVVYIVLGILYESYIHPLTILSTLPSAGVGALLILMIFHQDLSLMGIIGIILLIGIVKKNGIMMIDVALVGERQSGLAPSEAIRQAALLRFRPIMMTSMTALLGALPLIFSGGAGAELRQPLGITIVGGLILSQILTLYTTPVIYIYLARLGQLLGGAAPATRPRG
jgi:multidrug efflux pump